MTTTHATPDSRNRGPHEWIVDRPIQERVEVRLVARAGMVTAALIGLVVVIVLAILIVTASIQPPRPMNSHPGDAQPPPVGYVVIDAAPGSGDHPFPISPR